MNLKIETDLVSVTTHFKDLGNPPWGKFPCLLRLVSVWSHHLSALLVTALRFYSLGNSMKCFDVFKWNLKRKSGQWHVCFMFGGGGEETLPLFLTNWLENWDFFSLCSCFWKTSHSSSSSSQVCPYGRWNYCLCLGWVSCPYAFSIRGWMSKSCSRQRSGKYGWSMHRHQEAAAAACWTAGQSYKSVVQ